MIHLITPIFRSIFPLRNLQPNTPHLAPRNPLSRISKPEFQFIYFL